MGHDGLLVSFKLFLHFDQKNYLQLLAETKEILGSSLSSGCRHDQLPVVMKLLMVLVIVFVENWH